MLKKDKEKFVVISDPGLDDLLGLALLSKIAPNSDCSIISSFGNASEENTARSIEHFLSITKLPWSFSRGFGEPVHGNSDTQFPTMYHGEDGVWGTLPNKIKLRKKYSFSRFQKEQTVFSLGPLTTAASLIQNVPVKELYVMGGVFFEKGNVSDVSEFNLASDIDASVEVLCKSSKSNIYIIPLDVTHQIYWTKEEVLSIPETNPFNSWIKKIFLKWYDNYDLHHYDFFPLHDPLVIYLHFFPQEAKWIESGVAILLEGEQRGRIYFDHKNPTRKVAIDLKDPGKISRFLFKKIFLS